MSLQKKSYLQLSLCALLCLNTGVQAQLSSQAALSTYQGTNGPWKYLEYLFIIKPQNELKYYTDHAFAAFGGAGALYLASSLFAEANNKQKQEEIKPNFLQNMLKIASVVAAGKTVNNFFICHMQRSIQKKALSDFLKKWDIHRQHIPTSLVECFDELALIYRSQNENMLTTTMVAEVFELITHHIEHHFENRYKQAEKKNVDPVENFKNITEVWSNLKK